MAHQITFTTATRDVKTLGIYRLYSAVFETKTRRIIGVVQPQEPESNHSEPDAILVWYMENGVFAKCETTVSIPVGKNPKDVTLVSIDGKSKLVLGTANERLSREIEGSQQLWETDFHTGDMKGFNEIDSSTIVTSDTCKIDPVGWKNFLFVSSIEDRTSPFHVYVDLKYHSKIAKPWGFEMTTFSFSDKYVVVSVYDRETCKDSILAYSWSPEKLEIEEQFFGPVPGCGNPGQLAPMVVTQVENQDTEFEMLGIYNMEDKSCTQIQFRKISSPLRLVFAIGGRYFVIPWDGVVYELH